MTINQTNACDTTGTVNLPVTLVALESMNSETGGAGGVTGCDEESIPDCSMTLVSATNSKHVNFGTLNSELQELYYYFQFYLTSHFPRLTTG